MCEYSEGLLVSPCPTPAPSFTPQPSFTYAPTSNTTSWGLFAAAGSYGPWWVSLVGVVGVTLVMGLGIKQVLWMAEQKRKRIEKNLKRLRKRIIDSDDFYKEHGYSWDWAFVFNVAEAEDKPTEYMRKNSVRNVVTKLSEAGLQTTMFYSVQQDEVYLKIRATPERLKVEADRINLQVPLNADLLKALCERGREESHGWKPTRFSTGNKLFPKDTSPYEGMYCAYDQQRDSADDIPYLKFGDGAPPQAFDNVMRIKLISSIIEAPVANQGCGLKLKDLTSYRACLACFPLHDHLALTFLQQKWMRICTLPHRQPEDDIKNYFGEKIGLYFVWLGHYTKWLMTASLVGLGAWTSIAALGNNPDSPAIPYFTVFMCVWTTLYLESWKRAEKRTALRWGMIDFEQEQQSRPEFEAIAFFRESPVTGLQEKYFPPEKRNPVLLYSNFVSSSYIVTVAAGIIAIYWFKAWLSSPLPFGKVYLGKGPTDDDEGGANNGTFALGGIIGSAMNAVQIQVMNTIYEAVALRLTNAENHRTETQFEDALISKTFSFQFVNSFMALIYLAFIKTPLAAAGQEQRCFPNCFQELNTSLGIIFISNIVSGNLGEILPPILAARAKAAAESKGSILADAGVKLTDVEKQFIAEEYDVLMGTFKDYGEMVIQYGYCTLFVAAFPLAPLLALVNNWIELRVDGWKLVQMHRRPFAVGAEDIGTWFSFLEIMSTLAVISNVALFVFTGSQLKDWGWLYRVIFFIVLEHILLTVKFMIAFAIPDVPEDVENAQAREDYLLSKVRDNVADEEEEEEYDTVEMVDLSVKLTDLVPAMDAQAVKSAMV